MAAFVPEDKETTMLYVRLYQKFLIFPVLKDLVNCIMMQFNRFVLNQDRSVVTSQEPKYSYVYNIEMLVSADSPIMLFRKYLHDKMKEQGS